MAPNVFISPDSRKDGADGIFSVFPWDDLKNVNVWDGQTSSMCHFRPAAAILHSVGEARKHATETCC